MRRSFRHLPLTNVPLRRWVGLGVVALGAASGGCGPDRERTGEADDEEACEGCLDDCEGLAPPSTTGEGASSGAGASGTGNEGNETSGTGASSSGEGGEATGAYDPQCVAWVEHMCAICRSNCSDNEAFLSACSEGGYRACADQIDCQIAAADCADALDCPSCRP